jgi:uncharacterized DUF497 family protein
MTHAAGARVEWDEAIVLVVWTDRDEDVVRIISARWATKDERARYVAHMEQLT